MSADTVTAIPKNVSTRSDDLFQLATQFAVTFDEDGFFLAFSAADPYNIGPDNPEVTVYPVAKVFVGRNMMQNIIRVLLDNSAIQQLPALKESKEKADGELAALRAKAGGNK